jgi:hypothetical protein
VCPPVRRSLVFSTTLMDVIDPSGPVVTIEAAWCAAVVTKGSPWGLLRCCLAGVQPCNGRVADARHPSRPVSAASGLGWVQSRNALL